MAIKNSQTGKDPGSFAGTKGSRLGCAIFSEGDEPLSSLAGRKVRSEHLIDWPGPLCFPTQGGPVGRLRLTCRGRVRPRRASPLDGAVSGHERFRGAEIVWPGTRTGTQVEGSYQARLASTNWIKRRDCLEELKTHRLKLMADFNRLRPDLNFDSSPALRDLAEDLAAIDAGFDWTCRSYRANGNKR